MLCECVVEIGGKSENTVLAELWRGSTTFNNGTIAIICRYILSDVAFLRHSRRRIRTALVSIFFAILFCAAVLLDFDYCKFLHQKVFLQSITVVASCMKSDSVSSMIE